MYIAVLQVGSYEESLALIRDDVEMTDEERDWLLRKTAESVYFGGDSLPEESKLMCHGSRSKI